MAEPNSTPDGPPAGFDANHPTIISLLYLAGFITGVTGIVGIVLAYVWKDEDAGTWAESHNTYLRRTFWIGLLIGLVSSLLTLVLIGFLGFLFLAVWMIVRCVKSILAAQKREPMPDPNTWFF